MAVLRAGEPRDHILAPEGPGSLPVPWAMGWEEGAVSHMASPTEGLRHRKGLPQEAVRRRHVQSTCL